MLLAMEMKFVQMKRSASATTGISFDGVSLTKRGKLYAVSLPEALGKYSVCLEYYENPTLFSHRSMKTLFWFHAMRGILCFQEHRF